MAWSKEFNITGPCIPSMHYMVDISGKIDAIIADYVDKGVYFTINRARQYGKTTTLALIESALKYNCVVIRISFEGFGSDVFTSEKAFISTFISKCSRSLLRNGIDAKAVNDWRKNSDALNLPVLEDRIMALVQSTNKHIILIIDEVDKSSNNQLFMDFLGMLRDMYLEKEQHQMPAFHSVILAGVHDIKNLKNKMRPEDKHSYNSPWNIAASFDIDMSFSAPEIATMLDAYERDYITGMDIAKVAERLRYYTSGYPFLVSLLCKTMHDEGLAWTSAGVDEAEKRILKTNNTLFDDVIKNLTNNPGFGALVRQVLVNGADIAFQLRNPDIDMGLMYGIIKEKDSKVAVSNIIFETVILDYFISIDAVKIKVSEFEAGAYGYVSGGKLDMARVLDRFAAFMRSEYRDEDGAFIEREGRLLFLSFLKPIINGAGHYVVEPETRGSRRMDVVVFYGGEEHIVELKLWRGEQAAKGAYEQLTAYLRGREQSKGYLLSFCDNKTSPRAGRVFSHNGCEITEVIIAYRDNE